MTQCGTVAELNSDFFAGETSPAKAGSPSSGFSDDDNLYCDASQSLEIKEFIENVLEKGRNGLQNEYLEIKALPPDGTFEESK